MAAAIFTGAAAQETSATQTAAAESENKAFATVGASFYSFDNFENYGISMHGYNPNGISMDLNLRMNFKSHGNVNADLGINYSFQLWEKENANLLLTAAAGPSYRSQDEARYNEKENKIEWKEKSFFDLFINPRLAFRYKKVAISAGYFLWATKFKFSKEYRGDAFAATLSYAF